MSEKKPPLRSGHVSIVGRPNVGKSTLLNKILNEKVAIVSPVPQTTRNPVRGIYTEERGQIIFIDTPGIHEEKDHLDRYMNRSSEGTMSGADCIIHLVDVQRRVGEEEKMVMDCLKDIKVPVILGLNKVDIKEKYMDQYLALWQEARGETIHDTQHFVILPLSSKTGINVPKLIDLLFERLPEGPLLYPADILTDFPQKMAIADIIREKFFMVLRDELPHAVAVIVEQMVPRKNNVMYIGVQVLVERPSQKEIVIGQKGRVLKQVGSVARTELETLLEQKVFLDLYVKFRKDWRDNMEILKDMGMETAG